MWNQREPLGLVVELTPPADVTRVGKEEVDRAIEFVGPFSSVRDGAPLRIDQNDGAGWEHRAECLVQPPNDASPIMAGQVVFWRK